MQTRKRARSVTFGRKPKEKEKEQVTKTAAESAPEAKEESPELSTTLSDAKPVTKEASKEEVSDKGKDELVEQDESETATAKDEFLTDTSPAKADPTDKKDEAEPTVLSDNLSPVTPDPLAQEEKKDTDLSAPVSPEPVSPSVEPEKQEQLSPTPPQSAFTLQGDDGTDESVGSTGKKRFGLYFFIVALLSFVLGLGAMAAVTYFGIVKVSFPKELPVDIGSVKLPGQATPTPTKAPEPTATPTPEPADKSAYTIVVLNGSGIVGKAAEVQTDLEKAGFTISSVGNAQRNDYVNTQISVKKGVPEAYKDELQEELGKKFELDKISTIPDDSSQTSDVVVTLGSQAAK